MEILIGTKKGAKMRRSEEYLHFHRKQIVFNDRVANELMAKGHKLLRVERNKKFPKRMVYFFRVTPSFYDDFNEATKLRYYWR